APARGRGRSAPEPLAGHGLPEAQDMVCPKQQKGPAVAGPYFLPPVHRCASVRLALADACRVSTRVRPDGTPGQSPSDTRRRFAPAVHLELLQDIVDVILDGGHLDPQPLRDLLVREALVDEPH